MRILFITPRIPFPLLNGDRLRTYYFIRELSRRHEIDLYALCENAAEASGCKEMRKFCRRVHGILLPPVRSYLNALRGLVNLQPLQVNYYYCDRMKRRIAALTDASCHDVVHIVLQRMMPYAASIVDRKRIVLDHIDALSLNMKRRALAETNPLKKAAFFLEYLNMRKYEQDNRDKYAASVVTSEADKIALEDDRIRVVPNGVDTEYFSPERIPRDIDLVFTGNMSYLPNRNAAFFLCREILPRLLERFPGLKVYIAGVKPSPDVQALADNRRVFVTGYVEDIRWYLHRANLFVAPLRSGTGIQNKILEAMACGLPVVTSPCGNSGVRGVSGLHLMVAESAGQFVETVTILLRNASLRALLGTNARAFVEREFSWPCLAQRLEDVYRGVQPHSLAAEREAI